MCWHHRWHIRQSALQNTVRERNLKVRTPCFVTPSHVVPTAFSDMTHSCTQNSVKTATGVFDFGLKCHFSGLLFPKSANNRHSSMILYIPSAILGRNHGQGTIFQPFIRATGEILRTGSSTIHFADILGKKLPKCLPEHYLTGTSQGIFQHGALLAHRSTFPKKDLTGTSQSVRAFRFRSHRLT